MPSAQVRAVTTPRVATAASSGEVARREHEQARAGIGIARIAQALGPFVCGTYLVVIRVVRREPVTVRLGERPISDRLTH